MNKEVNFEIAKLLKEKGFDTPTFYYYENEKLVEPYLENGSSTDTEFRVDLSDLQEHFNKWSKKVSAPTIAEVVMWLYEKHEIWISVGVDSLFYKGKHHFLIYKNQGCGLELSSIENSLHGPYESPTEAYSSAIEYTLKNLI